MMFDFKPFVLPNTLIFLLLMLLISYTDESYNSFLHDMILACIKMYEIWHSRRNVLIYRSLKQNSYLHNKSWLSYNIWRCSPKHIKIWFYHCFRWTYVVLKTKRKTILFEAIRKKLQWLQPFPSRLYLFWQVLSLLVLYSLRTVSNQFADPAFLSTILFVPHNHTRTQNTSNIVVVIHYDSMSSFFAQNKLLR